MRDVAFKLNLIVGEPFAQKYPKLVLQTKLIVNIYRTVANGLSKCSYVMVQFHFKRPNVQGEGREPLCGEASLSTAVLAINSAEVGLMESRTVASALLTRKALAER